MAPERKSRRQATGAEDASRPRRRPDAAQRPAQRAEPGPEVARPGGSRRAAQRPAQRAEPDEDDRRTFVRTFSDGIDGGPGRHGYGLAHRRAEERESLRLTELLREDLVRRPLRATDQWGVVDELIRLMVSRREMPAGLAAAARAAVREREGIRPTGWKYGLAFPHGRVVGLKRIAAALGVSPGGVDFACRDGLPARIIVLVLLPEACYSRFSQGIDALAETFEDTALREAVLSARTAAGVVEAVEDAESRELA